MTNPQANTPRKTTSLVMSIHDIPFEGLAIETTEKFIDLFPSDQKADVPEEVKAVYVEPIRIVGSITPVRESKVDLRGECQTAQSLVCDRCSRDVKRSIKADISMFLMPSNQFSTHDKPEGKVIHAPTRGSHPSRHHSTSKAEFLSDAEGEHEDLNFGAFDGETVDIRRVIREQLVLQIPMSCLCAEACRGLCLRCGENVDDGACICAEGPETVTLETEEKPPLLEGGVSALGRALKSKIQKEKH